MTLHHLFRILAARKWWIGLSIVILCAIAAIVLSLVTKRYTATASVVVNARGNDPLLVTSSQSPIAAGYIGTQIDIIRRPRVAKRVVADLRLDADPESREGWQKAGSPGDFTTWLAQVAAGGLTVTPSADSNVIDIQYRAADPAHAARMANAYAQAYIATSLELRTDPARRYVTFFDQRITELRTQLEQAQARLSSFEKSSGLVNAGGKIDVENARFSELSTQLALAQSQQADSSSRQRGAQGTAATSPEVIQNPVVQQLKGQVSAQQVKVREMSLRLGPNHPEYLRARGELDELQIRLNAEIAQVASSLATAGRISNNRVAEVRSALDSQRQRVLALQHQRDQAGVMQKEVENAQRAYDLVMQRQSQTTLESQAQQTDVSLLDSATAPSRAAWPNVPLTMAMALIAGALIGIMLSLAREYLSPVVRSAADLATYTGLPVLAVIPSARLARTQRMALPGTGSSRGALPA